MIAKEQIERQKARERGIDFDAVTAGQDGKKHRRAGRSGRLASELFREALTSTLRLDPQAAKELINAKRELFQARVATALRERRGRPTKFSLVWNQLGLNENDAELLFSLTLYEMLQCVLIPLPGVSPAGTAGEDVALSAEESDGRVETEADPATLDPAAAVNWMPQQQVYQRVWEDILLECSLRGQTGGWAVAKRLRDTSIKRGKRAYIRKKQIDTALSRWDIDETDGQLFAGDLVRLVLEQVPGWFDLKQIGGRRGLVCLVPMPSLLDRVAGLSHTSCIIDRNAPLIVPPKEWGAKHGVHAGAFYSRRMGFYKFRQKNERIRQFLAACDRMDFTKAFRAVNTLQNTGWRINERVWNVAERLLYRALLSSDDAAHGPLLGDWDQWLRKNYLYRSDNGCLVGPGARLSARTTLNMVMSLRKEEEFFFAYQADTRGRLYPVTGWLSPQGEDLSIALLEFTKAKPITSDGAAYLAIHGSQQVKSDRILMDLGAMDRTIPTLEDRRKWVDLHAQNIRDCARDPLTHTWWRDVTNGKKRFQFLAFCFAWADYLEIGPNALCALPIHQDGVCNGLQHIAALTRDPALLDVANLSPGEPQDIYLRVAASVQKFVEDNAKQIPHGGFLLSHPEFLGREIAKAVVMIIPYGAGREAYERKLHEELKAMLAAPERQTVFKDFCSYFGLSLSGSETPSNHLKKKAVSDAIKQLAQALGGAFVQVLARDYPVIGGFKRWLQRVIRPVTERNIPVMWESPCGLPVMQRGFKSPTVEVESTLFGRLRFTAMKLVDDISPPKELSGILPNFIHSLDSAHLMKTVLLAKKRGVQSFSVVHDSFGTHPADMPLLARCIREAFLDIYGKPGALENFQEWISALIYAIDNSYQISLEKDFKDFKLSATQKELLLLAAQWARTPDTETPIKKTAACAVLPPANNAADLSVVLDSQYFFA